MNKIDDVKCPVGQAPPWRGYPQPPPTSLAEAHSRRMWITGATTPCIAYVYYYGTSTRKPDSVRTYAACRISSRAPVVISR